MDCLVIASQLSSYGGQALRFNRDGKKIVGFIREPWNWKLIDGGYSC